MPVIEMPDGNKVDLGDNPSPEMKAALARKYQELEAAKTPTSGVTTTTQPGATDTTSTSTEQPAPDEGYGPTIARTALPIAGGVIGGLVAGPPGAMAGAALGGTAGDVVAQDLEMHAGARAKYNPYRTLAEAGTNAAFAGLPMGDFILPAVAKAGGIGVVSSNVISIADGKGVNTAGQNAFAFLTAGGLQAVGHYAQVRNAAVKEIAGVPEIEGHLNVLTSPNAPTHGPDGVPTEIPAPSLLDEFGKPVKRLDAYPPELMGPPDPAAAIVPTTPTTGTPGETKIGQTPVKRDTGLSLSSRKNQAKQAVLDTWMEQRRPGIFEVEPIKEDIPPLESIPTKGELLEPDGGMADLLAQGKDAPKGMPGDETFPEPSDLTTNVMQYVGRTKTYFKRLEDETGFPVYQDYDMLSQANRKFQVFRQKLSDGAGKALRGSDRTNWTAILEDFSAGADGQTLHPQIRAKAQALSGVLDKSMEPFGLTSRDLFTEFLPAMKEGNKDVVDSAKFAKFGEALAEGKVNLKTTDLPRMVQQITNMGAFEEHAADTVEHLKAKYSSNMEVPEAIRQAINYYTGVLDGTADHLKSALGAGISHTFDKFGWTVDGDGVANRIITSQYAAMMAGRPGPVIRNAFQPIQTGVGLMGPSWLAEGYRQMATKAGRLLVENSGVSADSVMNELASLGKTTRPGKLLDRTIAAFMTPFGKVENINRGTVYLGTRAKILWAAEKYGDDIGTFLTKSGVGRYTKQEANIVMDLFSRGKLDEAADRGAQMMVDNTQFMYSQFERARIMTGAGRSLGAFGMWPMQYGGYIARLFQKGANGTTFDVARDVGRFAVANAALFGTFYKAAKFLHDETAIRDNLGWLFVSPAIYTGSPLMDAVQTSAKILQQGAQGKKPTKADVFRAVTPFVPFGGAAQDVMKARKEPNALEKIGRYASIKRGASPKDTGFKAYGTREIKGF